MPMISSQQLWILLPGLFCIAFVFSMFGRGGGEFILPLLISVLSLPFFSLATISLFLIFSQGLVMLIVYGGKHKLVDWPLAIALSVIIGTFAFLGGYFSFYIKPIYLKGTFAVVLLISAYKIWQGKKVPAKKGRFGTWHRQGDAHVCDPVRSHVGRRNPASGTNHSPTRRLGGHEARRRRTRRCAG